MRAFSVEPWRAVAFSLVFSVIVVVQGSMSWGWWLPVAAGNAALFYVGHALYVWANNKIRGIVEES
ncbi:hypothetical protein H7347_05170 [Corynebacterium sp. zg-331]|uniref:hypothetical protein n=1 Tax=unclassified Corynebacterium TaxID=2624378 RepID=UPI00128CF29B|nr:MULTISPECIES: hypothetical protein [unclassified Corynebacterium]MBC3185968.1 hypothetical protein [Corynebacterium sp. zg-331]MPV52459.1 hypothetical protein [Corynebacterium sp. zg331]